MGYFGPFTVQRATARQWYYSGSPSVVDCYVKFTGKGVLHWVLFHSDGNTTRPAGLDGPYVNIDGDSAGWKDVEGGADWHVPFYKMAAIKCDLVHNVQRLIQYQANDQNTLESNYTLGLPFKTSCQVGMDAHGLVGGGYLMTFQIIVEGDDLTVTYAGLI